VKHLSGAALCCWLLALSRNIRLGWKGLLVTDILAYLLMQKVVYH